MYALSAVLTAVLGLSVAAPADPAPDAKTELAKWQGTWQVELELTNGAEKPAKDRSIEKLIVKDDVWEVFLKDSEGSTKGKMKFVLDGKLKGLDVTVGDAVYRCVYLLDGDRAVLRSGDDGDERPKDFSTSTGSKTGAIVIYKRVKKP
jgi:uncharacterized protein (TIGR03067 family)